MKWKSAFFALLVGVGMTMSSCSDNDDVKPDINVDPETELKEGEGYFSLNLSTATKLLTKADYDPNDPTDNREVGDDDENMVGSAIMVFYNPSTLLVVEQFKLDITNGDGKTAFDGNDKAPNADGTKISAASVVTKARKLEKKDYKLLVVLNPTQEMIDNTVKGKSYSNFEDVKTPAGGAAYFNTGNGATIYKKIPMTNVAGLVNVVESQFKEEEIEAEQAIDMPVVKVDRMVAKVTFSKLPDPASGTGDGNSTIKYPGEGDKFTGVWKLDITNQKTFWMRHLSLTAPGTGDGTGDISMAGNYGYNFWKHESTFNQLLRDYIYAEDPNFSGLSQKLMTPTDPDANQLANFNYETDNNFTGKAINTEASRTREYALENTMAAEEQWEDVTTRILIRGNYAPKRIGENASYFYFGGYAFGYAEVKAMYDDMLATGNSQVKWPTTPSTLKDAVIKASAEGFFNTAGTPDVWDSAEPAASKVSNDGSITFYKDGISYYRILVRHFSEELSKNNEPPAAPDYKMNFGRYGIVRNNVYNVELQSVTGPGSPTIPKPGGPDDGSEAYISAQIKVLPWVVRTQGAEI